MENKEFELSISDIIENPEAVLRILGRDGAAQLISKLSAASPEAEAILKDCALTKMIESGSKIVTGRIILDDGSEEKGAAENE